MPGRRGTVKQRIQRHIIVNENGCWIWQGARSGHKDPRQQYGIMSTARGQAPIGVHRAAYLEYVGPIGVDENGKTLVVDHLCYDSDGYSNKLCCNPEHLDLVTDAENKSRGYKEKRKHGWIHYKQRKGEVN